MEASQTCGMIYLAGWHALFPAPLSVSSFPYPGRTHDFESLEHVMVKKVVQHTFHEFSLQITRFPQTSFEDKVAWFSFLNSIFINI